jgi:hypothetical protein
MLTSFFQSANRGYHVKFFVQIMAGCGAAAFFIGALMRMMDAEKLLNAPPEAWWRASMSFLTVGILYALIEIRDTLKSK